MVFKYIFVLFIFISKFNYIFTNPVDKEIKKVIYLEADSSCKVWDSASHRMMEAVYAKYPGENDDVKEVPVHIEDCKMFGDRRIIEMRIKDLKGMDYETRLVDKKMMSKLLNYCSEIMLKKMFPYLNDQVHGSGATKI